MFEKKSLFSFLAVSLLCVVNFQLHAAPASHFERVDAYLEQGGVLYGFVDIDGDVDRLAKSATELLVKMREALPEMAQIPPLPLDVILDKAGLSSIQAIGLSSTVRGRGFHNRTMVLTDGAPSGLLSLYGTENASFSVLDVAPADADLVAEQGFHPAALIEIAREFAIALMGSNGGDLIDLYLNIPIPKTSITARDLEKALAGRAYMIIDLVHDQTIHVPELGVFPKVDFLFRLESAAELTEKLSAMPVLELLPEFKSEKLGDLTRLSGFFPENPWISPVVVSNASSGEFFVASSVDYFESCLSVDGPKLRDSELYAEATVGLPKKGNALGYFSPAIGEFCKILMEQSIEQGGGEAEMMRPYMEWSLEAIMSDSPMASVSSVEASGCQVVSNWSVSHKRNLATLSYANPVTIGLLSSMAVPAFQKVRVTSQERAITNNLRMLASGAQQYFLEEGVDSVKTEILVGPGAYILSLDPVAGETYPEVITLGDDEVVAILPSGEEIRVAF